ncbi:hypothetical protein DVH24_014479 [Malus domestica]|uniref:Endonuclease/exonuclease/phosphatase domain-containing protein n=1 Tax=Malus domestica TaxID=3750 RepID=A0A498KS99_MALDO|nr:hypothetical protein DVH24_014479 [Malus domestica]
MVINKVENKNISLIHRQENLLDFATKTKFIKILARERGQELINVISVYAPQVRLDRSLKEKFWKYLRELVQGISQGEKFLIGGDFNGHAGKETGKYKSFHVDHGFGERN